MFKIWHCVTIHNFENICSPYLMSSSDYDRKYREKTIKKKRAKNEANLFLEYPSWKKNWTDLRMWKLSLRALRNIT